MADSSHTASSTGGSPFLQHRSPEKEVRYGAPLVKLQDVFPRCVQVSRTSVGGRRVLEKRMLASSNLGASGRTHQQERLALVGGTPHSSKLWSVISMWPTAAMRG